MQVTAPLASVSPPSRGGHTQRGFPQSCWAELTPSPPAPRWAHLRAGGLLLGMPSGPGPDSPPQFPASGGCSPASYSNERWDLQTPQGRSKHLRCAVLNSPLQRTQLQRNKRQGAGWLPQTCRPSRTGLWAGLQSPPEGPAWGRMSALLDPIQVALGQGFSEFLTFKMWIINTLRCRVMESVNIFIHF